jgi:hypothetical protein
VIRAIGRRVPDVDLPRKEASMSRRSTPERIYAARRSAIVNRLIGEGELPAQAEARLAAREARTAQDGLDRDGRWWDAAYRGIVLRDAT